MTRTLKLTIIISSLILIVSTVGFFFVWDQLIMPIIWFISINTIVIGLALHHINKVNSTRYFGSYLLILILIFMTINFEDSWGIKSIIFVNVNYPLLTIRTFLYGYLIGFSIFSILNKEKFTEFKKRNVFIITIFLIGLYLITEIPIFNIHGDIGGNSHGHSLWGGGHFH